MSLSLSLVVLSLSPSLLIWSLSSLSLTEAAALSTLPLLSSSRRRRHRHRDHRRVAIYISSYQKSASHWSTSTAIYLRPSDPIAFLIHLLLPLLHLPVRSIPFSVFSLTSSFSILILLLVLLHPSHPHPSPRPPHPRPSNSFARLLFLLPRSVSRSTTTGSLAILTSTGRVATFRFVPPPTSLPLHRLPDCFAASTY